ncbi:hypothetical protein BN14_06742 [Rhizoctonia solani AG-1 IB]|uniref:Uncharacterized protein n=1 Tax=Thanatephorus cucumeris (strain AG1-IB / isolate 7/3/14) TaxID=1108050 RepID=M5BZT5_THACB|nr:hypothetical protein BN14_06742 [Rhizoctonia solani AG-1 IB]
MPAATPFEPATVSLLSSPVHDFLVASFMARRHEYGLQIDEESFLTSFALPPDHPSAVRPALRNAVYLLACRALNAQTPALAQYEPSFVDKVRQGIANALEAAQQDNGGLFTGVILASILLARYLLIMGRIREAYHQTASVARFVNLGVHMLEAQAMEVHHRAHEALHHPGSGTSTRLFTLGRLALNLLRDAPPLDYFDDNNTGNAEVNPCVVKILVLAYVTQIKISLAQHGRAAYGDSVMHQIAAQVAGILRRAQSTAGLDALVGVCCAFTLGFLKRASVADPVSEQLEKSLAYLRATHVVLADPHLEARDLL